MLGNIFGSYMYAKKAGKSGDEELPKMLGSLWSRLMYMCMYSTCMTSQHETVDESADAGKSGERFRQLRRKSWEIWE